MRITTTKAHPQGRGRRVTKAWRITSIGATGTNGGTLPYDTTAVSISVSANDGEDLSTSSRMRIEIGLDDSVDSIDRLIGKLTDLRAKIREIAMTKVQP